MSKKAEKNRRERVADREQSVEFNPQAGPCADYYKVLFENIQYEVHIWRLIYSPDGGIKTWSLIDANTAALKSWGKKIGEIRGKLTDDIFLTNATEQFLPVVNKIFREQQAYSWDSYFEGTGQHLSMTSIPCDGYFISTGLDITTTKETERQHRDTLLQLQEAISAGNIGLWDWNLLTDETYFSPEWKRQLGYGPDDFPNEFAEWEKRVHPDDIQRTLKKINNTLTKGEDYHDIEFRMQHKNGSYRWILAHASRFTDQDGKQVRLLGSHIDITERKLMEEKVIQQQKMQALGTLAGGIAHDFNNLLTPILGYTQLIKMKLKGKEQEQEYLKQLESSANRAKELVQQILLMNRESVEHVEPVYLDKLVSEVFALVKTTLPKSIELEEDFEDGLPAIGADPAQIYRVLLNLCTNAVHAMSEGGRLTLKLYSCQKVIPELSDEKDDYVCIVVKDTGKGIDELVLKRIFEPFYTTKLKGAERGTGLGLSIVDSLIKQHKGHIEVKSQVGRGTEFTLYLPIIPTNTDLIRSNDEKIEIFDNKKVLIVDDEQLILDLATEILKELGCKVNAFQQSKDALDHLLDHKDEYDVVITDYAMPLLTGPDLINTLNEQKDPPPVIMASGFTNLITDKSQNDWNCAEVISKPYTLSELSAALARVFSVK